MELKLVKVSEMPESYILTGGNRRSKAPHELGPTVKSSPFSTPLFQTQKRRIIQSTFLEISNTDKNKHYFTGAGVIIKH